MIDKILDRYYMKKVLKELTTTPYFVKIKTEIKNGYGIIYIKKTKYAEKYYEEILRIPVNKSLYYYINIDRYINKEYYKLIEKYIKEN